MFVFERHEGHPVSTCRMLVSSSAALTSWAHSCLWVTFPCPELRAKISMHCHDKVCVILPLPHISPTVCFPNSAQLCSIMPTPSWCPHKPTVMGSNDSLFLHISVFSVGLLSMGSFFSSLTKGCTFQAISYILNFNKSNFQPSAKYFLYV